MGEATTWKSMLGRLRDVLLPLWLGNLILRQATHALSYIMDDDDPALPPTNSGWYTEFFPFITATLAGQQTESDCPKIIHRVKIILNSWKYWGISPILCTFLCIYLSLDL